MNRFQVMAIVSAIQRHEAEVFGDSCLTLQRGPTPIMGDLQKLIGYMERESEPVDVD